MCFRNPAQARLWRDLETQRQLGLPSANLRFSPCALCPRWLNFFSWRWTLDARHSLRPIIHLPDFEIRILLHPNPMPPAIHIMSERPRPRLPEAIELGDIFNANDGFGHGNRRRSNGWRVTGGGLEEVRLGYCCELNFEARAPMDCERSLYSVRSRSAEVFSI